MASSFDRQSAPALASWSENFIKSFTVTVIDPYTGSKGHVSNDRGTSIFWSWTWVMTFGSGVWQPASIAMTAIRASGKQDLHLWGHLMDGTAVVLLICGGAQVAATS